MSDVFESFVNIELAELVERGEVNGEQVLEAVGVLGLFHDAINPGALLSEPIDKAADALVRRILLTYPNEQGAAAEIVGRHLRAAFAVNPALLKLKQLFKNEVRTTEAREDVRAHSARAFLGLVAHNAPTATAGQDLFHLLVARLKDRR